MVPVNAEPFPGTSLCECKDGQSQGIKEYSLGALLQEYITLSTSPTSTSFFFVERKGGVLQPCKDYQGLNQVTVKYLYPLPLVPATLQQLCQPTCFTKLDLHSAHNLVRIRKGDERKAAFSTICSHYE